MTTDMKQWRIQQFMEIGFDEEAAIFLEGSKESGTAKNRKGDPKHYEHPLYWGTVKKFLDQGHSHHEALIEFCM